MGRTPQSIHRFNPPAFIGLIIKQIKKQNTNLDSLMLQRKTNHLDIQQLYLFNIYLHSSKFLTCQSTVGKILEWPKIGLYSGAREIFLVKYVYLNLKLDCIQGLERYFQLNMFI